MVNYKTKERILKAARGKQLITYNGNPIRPPVDFLGETLKSRREWHNVLKVPKG